MNKHAALEAGYANRDIQSGITFDIKIIFIYSKGLFFITFKRGTTYQKKKIPMAD